MFEAYVSLRVYAVYGSGFTYAQGTLNLMYYEPPTILRMYPVLASFDEGLTVSLAVNSFPFTAGIKCWFGVIHMLLVDIIPPYPREGG